MCVCLSVCVSVCVVTATHKDLWSWIHRSTNESSSHTKSRPVWPTLRVKIVCRKRWASIGIFKPAEPHSKWNAYSDIVLFTLYNVYLQQRITSCCSSTGSNGVYYIAMWPWRWRGATRGLGGSAPQCRETYWSWIRRRIVRHCHILIVFCS